MAMNYLSYLIGFDFGVVNRSLVGFMHLEHWNLIANTHTTNVLYIHIDFAFNQSFIQLFLHLKTTAGHTARAKSNPNLALKLLAINKRNCSV
jgi:hypothetical protein